MLSILKHTSTFNSITNCLCNVGFKFSRASYVLSLLRPKIITDLELKVSNFRPELSDFVFCFYFV